MSRRLQIPVNEAEATRFKLAARKAGMSLAEWARTLLREKATEQLGPKYMSAESAFESLCQIEAPVADVETMIEESTKGRYL